MLKLEQILAQVNGVSYPENKSGEFSGVAPLNIAQPEHVSFFVNPKYENEALQSNAGIILCSQKHFEILKDKVTGLLVICEDAYAGFAKVSQNFFKATHPFQGISDKAIIDQSAKIDPSATIFPFVFIGPGAQVGKNSILYSGVFIGAASTIGDDCILYPNVVVREGCRIGDRCLLNPGAIVGGDGFGFAPTKTENVKIPQIGGVEIADDVELGANAAIDRGAMADTKIGRQTKIDNLVTIGHNVEVGEMCFLAGQTGVAGSTKIGNHCVLAGQVGVVGHIVLCDNVTILAQSGVSKNITQPGYYFGSPARPNKEFLAQYAALSRLAKKRTKGE